MRVGPTAFLVAIAATASLLVPLFVVKIPPIGDYPDHLARMFILAHPENASLRTYYSPYWGIVPYSICDAAGVLLQRLFTIWTTGKILLGAAVFAPIIGASLYSLAIWKKSSPWVMTIGAFSYSCMLLGGAYNFYISCGLAFAAAALWVRFGERYFLQSVALSVPVSAILYLCHLYAIILYLVLIGAAQLATLNPSSNARHRIQMACKSGFALLPSGLVTAVFSYISQSRGDSGQTIFSEPLAKFRELSEILAGYPHWEIRSFLLIPFGLCWLCYKQYVVLPRQALIATAALSGLFIVSPYCLEGAELFSTRLAQMALWVFLASARPRFRSSDSSMVVTIFLFCFMAYRVIITCIAWRNEEPKLDAVGAAITSIAPGSKVLYASATRDELFKDAARYELGSTVAGVPTYAHFSALVILNQSSFCQLFLAVPGTTPIRVNAPYLNLSQPQGFGIPYSMLDATAEARGQSSRIPFLDHWQKDFDYVLLLPTALVPDAAHLYPDKLELVSINDFAALYRIRKD